MRAIYIARPLGRGADRERNRGRAASWAAWVAATFDVAVIADWIVLSSQWDESPDNRERGLAIDVELVKRADEVWMFGPSVSPGMAIEAEAARAAGKRVRDFTGMTREEIREAA